MYILFAGEAIVIYYRALTHKRANNVRPYVFTSAFDFVLKLLYNKNVCDIFIARKFNSNDRFQR